MQINDILAMDGEDEIRKLNIPSATINWSGPLSFKDASARTGSGLYVVVKKGLTPIYVGQTGSFRSRFRGRLYTLRQAACDLSRTSVYLGSIKLPRGWRKSRRNLRLDLESVLIRSYDRRKHKLVNQSSIRQFMMGPKDAVIRNKGDLPPKMKRVINVKRNEPFELDFGMPDPIDEEIRRRRSPIRRKTTGKIRPVHSRPSGKRPRIRRKKIRRRRRPFIRRPRKILRSSEPCICPPTSTEFVRWVQSSLNQVLGVRLRINGVMNRATREALRDFQKQEGLPVDGIAGPETEKMLIKAKSGN